MVALALCLVGAAPAHAAFAPDLTVTLDPPTVNSVPAITMVIAHDVTAAPIKRFTLALPAGFTPAGAPGAVPCPRASVQAGDCPGSSRVGAFAGELSGPGRFAGTIHKTGAGGFALHLSTLGGSVSQLVVGALEQRPDGSLDLRLQQLPALAIKTLAMRLDGGSRALVRTPENCASYTVDGLFTSRLGELAIDRSSIALAGCIGVPAVTVENIRFKRKRFRVGFNRRSRGTILAWWASRAADHTKVRIERRKRGRWRRLGALVGPADVGDNRVRWDGYIRGRALKPGRYALRVHPAGSAPSKRVRFKIRRG